MGIKRGAVSYRGPGSVQRLAKKLQAQFRITRATAIARAKAILGVS